MNMPQSIKSAIDLANDSYQSGYDEGRRIGFSEGLQAAGELIAGKSAEEIIAERKELGRVGRGMTT
jgi:hypothetical protein